MQVTLSGKQLDISDALKQHTSDTLTTTVLKYFDNAIDGKVVLSQDPHHKFQKFRSDVSVHIGHGIYIRSHAIADDPYAAIDTSINKVEKQLRRYNNRLNDHHLKQASRQEMEEMLIAQQYTLSKDDIETEEMEQPKNGNGLDTQPIIIAEEQTNIPTLSVRDAVMRMDLVDAPAFMFRNPNHGGVNIVYHRSDGNIGWIDLKSSESGNVN